MKNSTGKNFLLLLVGLGMLGSGLTLFFTELKLSTGTYWWGYFGNRNVIGITFIPLILGVVLWVFFPKNMWPKILTWVSVVAIILTVVSSLRVSYSGNAYQTVMYLILIFVGGSLALKKLYIDTPGRKKDDDDK